MKVCIVYVYAVAAGERYAEYALRFVNSYNENPPAIEHQSIVVLNGGRQTAEIACLFSSLQNVTFLERDNSGYDIGGYQEAAQKFPCDLMVFFGSSTYLKGAGWLLRMLQSFIKHGMGVYGVMANRGDDRFKVRPHLRTTGFWCPPELMNQYPHRITNNEQRYAFEHGSLCFFDWAKAQKLPVLAVSWTNEYEWKDWDYPNGFFNGDQSGLMCGDRLTELYHTP